MKLLSSLRAAAGTLCLAFLAQGAKLFGQGRQTVAQAGGLFRRLA